MTDPTLHDLKALEARIAAVLRHRGIEFDHLTVTGLLGRSQWSSVFSLLINHEYYVLKLYFNDDNFARERRNHRRLPTPPPVFLAATAAQSPLGHNFVITKVPQGTSFTSQHLNDQTGERLSRHLIELHRIRQSRHVSVAGLHQSVTDVEAGALKAAGEVGPAAARLVDSSLKCLHAHLDKHAAAMRVPKTLLHNDLWWDNIIVAADDVYLIDWEWLTTGDYAEDLAYFRVMLNFRPIHDRNRGFWAGNPDEAAGDQFLAHITTAHTQEFQDDSIALRLLFYLQLQALRRLSDYAAGTYGDHPALRTGWTECLARAQTPLELDSQP